MKRAFDLVAAGMGLLVLAPLLVLLSLAIALDSPGQVFFRQERVGRDGRRFGLWKFRTMQTDAGWAGPMLTERADRRVTRVGRLLRGSKLDELPQLINVMLGNMSLVGPRPELPQLVAHYTPAERQVLAVRPGITGPTQLSWHDEEHRYPPGVDVVDYYVTHLMHEKLRTDLEYVAARSFWGDLRILFRTVFALAGRGPASGTPHSCSSTPLNR